MARTFQCLDTFDRGPKVNDYRNRTRLSSFDIIGVHQCGRSYQRHRLEHGDGGYALKKANKGGTPRNAGIVTP
jgi:hypothetical protein